MIQNQNKTLISIGTQYRELNIKDFSSIKTVDVLPNLIKIQVDSYNEFLQIGIPESERTSHGLQAIFEEAFPIMSSNGEVALEFVNYEIGEPAKTIWEAKQNSVSYATPLRILLRLVLLETSEVREQLVYLGDIPLMTNTGTFVFNGAERVIVNQLHRSPGAFIFKDTVTDIYAVRIIPDQKGSWLEFEVDNQGLLVARIDRRKKFPFTLLVKALGFSTNEEVLRQFYESETLVLKRAQTKKLQQYFGRRVIANVLSKETGEVLLEAGASLNEDNLDTLRSSRVEEIEVIITKSSTDDMSIIIDSIEQDGVETYEDALIEFLKLQRPLEYISDQDNLEKRKRNIANGKKELDRLFFDPKNYDLGIVGRYKINSKFSQYNPKNFKDDTIRTLRPVDILEILRYLVNTISGVDGYLVDDIDHLGNRRVRSVGELLAVQLKVGFTRMERVVKERMSINDLDVITPHSLVSIKPITIVLNEFFGTNQLSQFMDQTNPIAELTHKRRLNALGPGGLTRERAGFEVRDIHYTHYGRVCTIETPEGPNIGLILSLATYARLNKYGFLESPYRVVKNRKATNKIVYLSANEEDHYVIAQANTPLDRSGAFSTSLVSCRFRGDFPLKAPEDVQLMDISPMQVVSLSTALIPFLEHDDANRALMGANMQRQAVPCLIPEFPFVGTGVEKSIAYDSGVCVISEHDGVVTKVDSQKIIVVDLKDKTHEYPLLKFQKTNQGTCINQRILVKVYHTPEDGSIKSISKDVLIFIGESGKEYSFQMKTFQGLMKAFVNEKDELLQGDILAGEKVSSAHSGEDRSGTILADGHSTECGRLALGKNITVAFMPFQGYNFEDAIIVSNRLVRDDVFTSIHIEEFEIQARDTKLGSETITRDIPNMSEQLFRNLDEDGIVCVGTEVKAGEVLVGMVTPKVDVDISPEYRLLYSIFGEKVKEVADNSLVLPNGHSGTVINVRRLSRENGDELPPVVNEVVKVLVAKKRKLSIGDKLAGRHGNKGVISKILDDHEMPFLPNGTSVDIILNPLGVPSRMNLGQIFETLLGVAAKELGMRFETPVFDGAKLEDIKEYLKKAGWEDNSKVSLRDGRTGENFLGDVFVGNIYMLKLNHMSEDKIHARSTGPYSLVTQQPLGGKAHFGGQRLGEMEVWALEAYGASYTLQEFLTVKSDDMLGRVRVYESVVRGIQSIQPGIPESFNVLIKEIRALALDIAILDEDSNVVDVTGAVDNFMGSNQKIRIDSFGKK